MAEDAPVLTPAAAPVRLVIHGANGRMGTALRQVVPEEGWARVVALLARAGQSGGDAPRVQALAGWSGEGDVVIDFSGPEALRELIPACARHRTALVSGTTGLDDQTREQLDELSRHVAVLTAASFSPGIHLLGKLLEDLAARLPAGYECELVETHHHGKVDAPSGTALELARRVARARGQDLEQVARWGRGRGRPGKRPAGEIGVHSLRMGEVAGKHEVWFAGGGEVLGVHHEASSRAVFARGALLAAKFLAGQPAGRYRFDDALASAAGRGEGLPPALDESR